MVSLGQVIFAPDLRIALLLCLCTCMRMCMCLHLIGFYVCALWCVVSRFFSFSSSFFWIQSEEQSPGGPLGLTHMASWQHLVHQVYMCKSSAVYVCVYVCVCYARIRTLIYILHTCMCMSTYMNYIHT
jgi:hypothetical protein